jgi:hypothetical protein
MSAQFSEDVKQSIERFDEMERRAIEAGWPRNSITIRQEANRRILNVNGVDVMEGGFRESPGGGFEPLSNVLALIPRPTTT